MNKASFLQKLRELLSGIPSAEAEEALDYYRDYFADAGEENEAKVIEELGSPEKVAANILRDLGYSDNAGEAKTDDNPKSKYIYGWIVLNRIDLMTNHQYGRQKKVLAYGKVIGLTGGATIQYKTFDGSQISISREDKGLNILHIPKWVDSESDLFVTLTNTSSYVSLGSIKATSNGFDINVLAKGTNSFEEGSFNFEISNFNDFNT